MLVECSKFQNERQQHSVPSDVKTTLNKKEEIKRLLEFLKRTQTYFREVTAFITTSK